MLLHIFIVEYISLRMYIIVCVCVFVDVNLCVYVCMYTFLCMYISVCVCKSVYICVLCTYLYVYTNHYYVCIFDCYIVCMCVHLSVQVHYCVYVYIPICVYTRVCKSCVYMYIIYLRTPIFTCLCILAPRHTAPIPSHHPLHTPQPRLASFVLRGLGYLVTPRTHCVPVHADACRPRVAGMGMYVWCVRVTSVACILTLFESDTIHPFIVSPAGNSSCLREFLTIFLKIPSPILLSFQLVAMQLFVVLFWCFYFSFHAKPF